MTHFLTTLTWVVALVTVGGLFVTLTSLVAPGFTSHVTQQDPRATTLTGAHLMGLGVVMGVVLLWVS